jgi:hypothetical protein
MNKSQHSNSGQSAIYEKLFAGEQDLLMAQLEQLTLKQFGALPTGWRSAKRALLKKLDLSTALESVADQNDAVGVLLKTVEYLKEDSTHKTQALVEATKMLRTLDEALAWLRTKLEKLQNKDDVIQALLLHRKKIRAVLKLSECARPLVSWEDICTAPVNGTWLLLAWPALSEKPVVGYCVHGVWRTPIMGDSWQSIAGPTHWSPLPKMPLGLEPPVLTNILNE